MRRTRFSLSVKVSERSPEMSLLSTREQQSSVDIPSLQLLSEGSALAYFGLRGSSAGFT